MKTNNITRFKMCLATFALSMQVLAFSSISWADSAGTKTDVAGGKPVVSSAVAVAYSAVADATQLNQSAISTSVGNSQQFTVINKVSQAIRNYQTSIKAPIVTISEKNQKTLLSWKAVSGAKCYKIIRGSRLGEFNEIASNIADLEYIDESARVNETFYYGVVAVNDAGEKSENSNILLKMTIPRVPVLFGGWENGKVQLRWTQGTDEEQYILCRRTSSNGLYIPISESVSNKFTDKDVDIKSEYYYVVRAANSMGDSGNSYELKISKDSTYQTGFIPYLDSDEDGLKNEDELVYRTDKDKMDTDGDGLRDGYEVNVSKTDPINPDVDGDGFLDGAEVALGNNPNKKNNIQKIEKYAKSQDGSAEVVAKGKNNLAITPIQIKANKNMELHAIYGIIGDPQDIYIGNQSEMQATLIFHYKDEQLLEMEAQGLSIFRVDTTNKKLTPLKDIIFDKSAKTVSGVIQQSGVYLLGNKNTALTFGNMDILFAIDDSSFLNGKEFENRRLDVLNQFLDNINQANNRFGILGFINKAYFKQKLTSNKKTIQRVFKSIDSYKVTKPLVNPASNPDLNLDENNITDELSHINQYFENKNISGKIVFLFSSKKNIGDKKQLLDMANALAKRNIKVYTLAFGKNADTDLLQNIARITKGEYFNLDNSGIFKSKEIDAQLKGVFKNLAGQFTSLDSLKVENMPSDISIVKENLNNKGNENAKASANAGKFVLKQEDLLPHPLGNGFTYNYKAKDKKYYLENVFDDKGKVMVKNTYDSLGRLVSNLDGVGKGIYLDYSNQMNNSENATKFTFDPRKDMGKADSGIGVLSEKYESRGAGGAACISNNSQDIGGKSYGAWQLASAVGTVDTFLKWLKDKLAEADTKAGTTDAGRSVSDATISGIGIPGAVISGSSSATPGAKISGERVEADSVARSVYKKLSDAKILDKGFGINFDAAWKEIAAKNYDEFLEIQSGFIKLRYYDIAENALKKVYGFDISQRSRGLKSVLFSTSVQHGTGAATDGSVKPYTASTAIFRKALEVCLGIPEGTLIKAPLGSYDFSKITDEEIINAVYDERSKYMVLEDMKIVVVKQWGRADASKVFPIGNSKSQRTLELLEEYGIANFVMYHFCGSGPDVQTGVYKRLDINERADALRMLRNPTVLP